MKKRDQKKVWECFEGTEEQVAALGEIPEEEEDEPKVDENPGKKKKQKRAVEDILQEANAKGAFDSLKNDDLKELLRNKGLPVGGKKEDLLERVKNNYPEPSQ